MKTSSRAPNALKPKTANNELFAPVFYTNRITDANTISWLVLVTALIKLGSHVVPV